MSRTPLLKIHCLLCNTDPKRRADGRASFHPHPKGDGDCLGSGRDRGEMLRILRQFESRDNTGPVRRTLEVEDNAETICLTSTLRLDGHAVAEITIDLPPTETARLIEQLTTIARDRKLM